MTEYFQIELTKGKVCLVSREDYGRVAMRKWHARADKSGKFYACRGTYKQDGRKTKTDMHRLLIECPEGYQIDHINGDSLDNRRENLRIATASENGRNRGVNKNNTTGIKGVTLVGGRYIATIMLDRKNHFLGKFKNASEAAMARAKASANLHGEFSRVA